MSISVSARVVLSLRCCSNVGPGLRVVIRHHSINLQISRGGGSALETNWSTSVKVCVSCLSVSYLSQARLGILFGSSWGIFGFHIQVSSPIRFGVFYLRVRWYDQRFKWSRFGSVGFSIYNSVCRQDIFLGWSSR